MSAQGTFAFLFIDIEGSTLLWEQRAAQMRAALERARRSVTRR